MRVAIISDTHLRGAASLSDGLATVLETADHVLHAGDVMTPQALGALGEAARGGLTAVCGNRDQGLSLPEVTTYEADGVRFVVTHGDGLGRGIAYRRGLAEVAAEYDADVAVGGHTHRPLDSTIDGVRVLNPGSATGTPPAATATLLTATCRDGTVSVTMHRPPSE